MTRDQSLDRSQILRITTSLLTLGGLTLTQVAWAEEGDSGGERRDRDTTRTHIAADMDFGRALDEPGRADGFGGALRIGQELDLFLVSLTPELGGSYHAFNGTADSRIYAGFLGGRLAFGKIVEPSIFGHVGVGRLEGAEAHTAPLMDAGLALDLTILPLIDLGLHAGYNVMLPTENDSALKWLNFGVHAALVL
jgi:hypothetical protein